MTDDLATRLLELSGTAWLTISPSGAVAAWSRGAEALYGYPQSEAVGRAADFLGYPGEGTVLASEAAGERGEALERHRRRDGSEVLVELRIAGSSDGLLVCVRDVSSERRAESGLAASRQALGAHRDELRRLARRLLDAQESERRRLARELHDDFKQRLGALGFKLASLAQRASAGGEDAATASGLETLIDRVEQLGDDLRRISHRLHPAAFERLGLTGSLESLAGDVETRHGLEVRVSARDLGEALPSDVALGLYRVAQEALDNVTRHAGARRVHLSLVRDQVVVRLAVADDGDGFDPAAARAGDGLGLASMEERARLLGGRLRLASRPGAGAEIEVVVPLAGDDGGSGDEAAPAAAGDGGEDDKRPRLIGPYQLLEVLGEGATATVYRAREPPPLAREVAIKLYRLPPGGRREALSFKAERQALARLRHPNVGQILEARTTEDGDPYLVMEYVPGMPITEYCDRYRLGLRRRLELLIAVCRGVQHVHQKGVLHRDLKPANVLVMERDGEPVPKIVDFGIAKGLEAPLAEGTVWSRGAAGTPVYVSPEALAGDDADTRCDVYSLGVVLYELLAGALPAATEAEILALVAGDGPPLPSRRLAARPAAEREAAASARRIGAAAHARALTGDLDWIAAKALARAPEARYAGAAALADDLGRYLRHQPVAAGPPALAYRVRRFARRHRAAVAAACLALLALLGGLAATAYQARRAARQAAEADQARQESEHARLESERVTEFLEGLFEVSDPSQARGREITAREILDRGALRLERELAGEPRIKARLERKVADIYRELGLFDEAKAAAEASLAAHRELYGDDHPETAKSLRALAHVVYQSGKPAAAEPLLERALAIQERTLGEDHLEVGESLALLALTIHRQGERERSMPLFRRSHEIVSASLPPEHPKAIQALEHLGWALEGEDPERARDHYQEALKTGEKHLGPDHPAVLNILRNLAVSHLLLSDFPSARAISERRFERLTRVYGPDHWRTLRAGMRLAEVTAFAGQGARAERLATETFERIEATLDPGHWLTAESLFGLGQLYSLRGRPEQAEAYLERALAAASASDPDVANVAHILSLWASVAHRRGDFDRAESLAGSMLERLADDSPLHRSVGLGCRITLASVALRRGDLERAEALARDVLQIVDPATPGAPTPRGHVHPRAYANITLGDVLASRGDDGGARRAWQLAVDVTAPLARDPWALHASALALLRLGRVEEARPIARRALAVFWDPELIELCRRHGIDVPPAGG